MFIPVGGCVGRGPRALFCPVAYNAVKMALVPCDPEVEKTRRYNDQNLITVTTWIFLHLESWSVSSMIISGWHQLTSSYDDKVTLSEIISIRRLHKECYTFWSRLDDIENFRLTTRHYSHHTNDSGDWQLVIPGQNPSPRNRNLCIEVIQAIILVKHIYMI